MLRCGLTGIRSAAIASLRAYAWPGNARQLEMVLRVAAGPLMPGAVLDVHHLRTLLAATVAAHGPEGSLRSGRIAGERDALARALAEHGGVVSHAASALGMSRQAFYKALRRTGLTAPHETGPKNRSTTG